jgi:hypothetical protein
MIRTLLAALAVLAALVVPSSTRAEAATLPRVAVTETGMAVNGQPFVARGANYVRLSGDQHVTFEPGVYDPLRAQITLTQLGRDGNRVVRAFIGSGTFASDTGIGGGPGRAEPFREEYLTNVVDFIKRANIAGVYVIPVLSLIPTNCYFYAKVWDHGRCDATVPTPNVAGYNAFTLDAGFVRAKAEYLRLFASEMVARLGSTAGILAYESENEANFETNQAPFATRYGSVTTLTGKTYDMANLTARQAAADEGVAEYARRVKVGLLHGDPDAKLMLGAFTNYGVGKAGFDGFAYCSGPAPCRSHADWRYPVRLWKATAVDLYDVHQYSRPTSYTVAGDLATAEVSRMTRPWVVGEYGAFKSLYPTVIEAAYAMAQALRDQCAAGAQGHLLWTADTTEQRTPTGAQELYTLYEQGGAINGQVAPVVRPTACATAAKKRR